MLNSSTSLKLQSPSKYPPVTGGGDPSAAPTAKNLV